MIHVEGNNGALVGLVFVGFGLFFFFRGFKLLKLKRTIDGLATSKIRSMAMGLVELYGTAHPVKIIADPIYLKPCVFYRIEVEEERGSGKDSHWVTVYKVDTADTPFLIRDDTGKALVLPSGADLQRTPTIQCSKGAWLGGAPDPIVDKFLCNLRSWSRPVRMTAHILREGDPVYLLGYTAPQPSSTKSFMLTTQEVAAKIKSSATLMKALDTNDDGQVDAQEWDKGIQDLKTEMDNQKIKQELAKEPETPPNNPPLIQKSPDGLLLIGSSEDDLTHRLGWASTFQSFGGPVMVLIGAYLLISNFR